ncbi:MAG: hemerythrin domain-containing protein [Nitrospiraceae bacterium]|nr:MAG: hemerythrin domain-containing protein [Nitrospiraceae bacterium]
MEITDKLKKQHEEIFKLMTEMSSKLNSDDIARDPSQVCKLISDLADDLNYHLTMEDHSFYPKLFNHPDKHIVETAQKFVREVIGIKDSFTLYTSRWKDHGSVQNNPDNFMRIQERCSNL